jgi:nucleoside diphosphate kinase/membrane protein YdbS with pleckstrin-like domain
VIVLNFIAIYKKSGMFMWDTTKKIYKLDLFSFLIAFIRGPVKSPLINPSTFDMLIQLTPFIITFLIFIGQDTAVKIFGVIIIYLILKNIIFLLSFKYQFSTDGVRYGYGFLNKEICFIHNSRIEQITSSSFYLEKRLSRSTISIRLRNNSHIYFYSILRAETKNIISSDIEENLSTEKPVKSYRYIFNVFFLFRKKIFLVSFFVTCLLYYFLASGNIFNIKEKIESEITEDRKLININHFNKAIDSILKEDFVIYLNDEYLSESESVNNKLIEMNLFFLKLPIYINKSHMLNNKKLEQDIKSHIKENRDDILVNILKNNDLLSMSKSFKNKEIKIRTHFRKKDKLMSMYIINDDLVIDKKEYNKMISIIISQIEYSLSTEKSGLIRDLFLTIENEKDKLEYDIKVYIKEKVNDYSGLFFDFGVNLFSGIISLFFLFFILSVFVVNSILSYFIEYVYSISIKEGKIIVKRSMFGNNIIEYNLNKNKSIIVVKDFMNQLYKVQIKSNGSGFDNKYIYLNKTQYKKMINNKFSLPIFNYSLIILNIIGSIINIKTIAIIVTAITFWFFSQYINSGPFNMLFFFCVLFIVIIKPTYKGVKYRNRLSLSMENVHFEVNDGGKTISKIVPYSDISTYEITRNKLFDFFNLSLLKIISNNKITISVIILKKHEKKIKSILKKGCNKK